MLSENIFYSKAKTFRKGVIGDWQAHFDEEISENYQDVTKGILQRFEYEPIPKRKDAKT